MRFEIILQTAQIVSLTIGKANKKKMTNMTNDSVIFGAGRWKKKV
jgi:hypothetical protein